MTATHQLFKGLRPAKRRKNVVADTPESKKTDRPDGVAGPFSCQSHKLVCGTLTVRFDNEIRQVVARCFPFRRQLGRRENIHIG